MRNINTYMRAGLAAMLAFWVIAASGGAVDQRPKFEGSQVTSELTGVEIEVNGSEFQIIDAQVQKYENGEGEVISIESISNFVQVEVSFFDDDDSASETIEAYVKAIAEFADVDSFEIVDQGTSGNHEYALVLMDIGGYPLLYYAQAEEDTYGTIDLFEAFMAEFDTSEDLMVAAQQEIIVDQDQFLGNVSVAELMRIANEGGSLGGSGATPSVEDSAIQVTLAESSTVIDLSPGFVFNGEPIAQGAIQYIRVKGSGTWSMIAVGQTGSDADEALDGFIEGLLDTFPDAQIVDDGGNAGSAWRLLRVRDSDGLVTIIVVTVDTTLVQGFEVMQAHALSPDNVAGSIIAIQNGISVDDRPALDGIDADDIAAATKKQNSSGTSAPAGNDSDGNPRDGARLPADDSSTTSTPDTNEKTEPTEESVGN